MKVTLLAPWLSRECQEPECQEPAQHAQGRMIFLRERIVLLKEALSSHAGEALNAVRKHWHPFALLILTVQGTFVWLSEVGAADGKNWETGNFCVSAEKVAVC